MNLDDSNAQPGDHVPEVTTGDVEFLDISLQGGGNPLKVSEPWKTHPPVHASLLSIASRKGLLAVAGPSTLVIADPESLRKKAIPARLKKGEERIFRENGIPVDGKAYVVTKDEPSPIPIKAHLTIDTPRLSHVAFSADESCLVIVSEDGGGLAVYDTNALLAGNKDHAFTISTNGVSVRHLLPNPSPEDALSPLFAIVLTNGQLLIADLKSRSLRKGQTGEALHNNVFSASWSKLGKQIIAGKGDGTCAQIDQQGVVKATLPVAPQLSDLIEADYQTAQVVPVTTILWLDTHTFFIIYSPVYGPQDPDAIAPMNDSAYFIAERKQEEPMTFRKLDTDPCPPFGLERLPANHFLPRLRGWEPNVNDLVITSSTASTDIGILANGRFATFDEKTKQKVWIPAEGTAYGCLVPKDGHTASVSASFFNDGEDTSIVGASLDFSSRIVAAAPLPTESDTIERSSHPLPCFCLVNTDGCLYMWWIVYADAIRQQKAHPMMVHQQGPYTTYLDLKTKYNRSLDDSGVPIAPEIIEDVSESGDSQKAAAPSQIPQPSFGQGLSGPRPATPTTATPSQPARPQSPAKPLFGGTSTLGGNKSSPWGGSSPAPAASTFGKPSFGQSSFGQAQTSNVSGFAQAAQKSGSGFGQIGGLGQNNKSPWAAGGQASAPSPFLSAAKPNPFAGGGQTSASPFGSGGKTAASPFTSAGQTTAASPFTNAGKTTASPFVGAGQTASWGFSNAGQTGQSAFATTGQNAAKSPFGSGTFGKPSLSNETSTGSTATLGSTGTFGAPSTPSGSSFGSKPALSKESTFGDGNGSQSGGLPSLSGFKLGSTFKGDGTAHDDLPKPKNPGGDLFGSLGKSLNDAENQKPQIKQEPGTEKQPSLKDIPAAKPTSFGLFGQKQNAKAPSDAPLPPDPSTFDYKKKQAEMPSIPGATPAASNDAPLPPDPSAFNYKKSLAAMAPPPGTESTTPPQKAKDFPIAGSPPQHITHSQTFSPAASEAGPPEDSGSEVWSHEGDDEDADGEEHDEDDEDEGEEEDDEEDEEGEDDDNEEEEGEEEDEDEDEDETPYQPADPTALNAFLKRVGPSSPAAAPPSPEASKPKVPSTTPKAHSYTPAGLPKGPVLMPSGQRNNEQSPRSPSPQRQAPQPRSVTSPVPKPAPKGELRFPPSIKTTAVPPAKPVERERTPAPPPKPRAPSAGELADEQDARVKAFLAQPIEPSKEMPMFHTHQDYTSAVETASAGGKPESVGLAGNIDTVYRDVNSMIDVVGLNARSLMTFIAGHERLRKPGQRSREDLEEPTAWTLGELGELDRVVDQIIGQLESGKLENVRDTLELLVKEQSEAMKLKAQTSEMRKTIQSYTDPARRAENDAAPLDAETAAQQSELRRKLRDVYQLLSDAEQSMSLLRADLASASSKTKSAPVPTMESVERTILRMTAMVEKTSGDIDLLESQIRRLPEGIASLRLSDDYEDDLIGRFSSSKLLTDSPSRKRTPQKYPRMAADGSALGMSGMFGSRFQTPPGSRSSPMRNSVISLRQSTGSMSGSARKKTMSDVTTEEVEAYYARLGRRREVLGALKKGVDRSGVRVTTVGEER